MRLKFIAMNEESSAKINWIWKNKKNYIWFLSSFSCLECWKYLLSVSNLISYRMPLNKVGIRGWQIIRGEKNTRNISKYAKQSYHTHYICFNIVLAADYSLLMVNTYLGMRTYFFFALFLSLGAGLLVLGPRLWYISLI